LLHLHTAHHEYAVDIAINQDGYQHQSVGLSIPARCGKVRRTHRKLKIRSVVAVRRLLQFGCSSDSSPGLGAPLTEN
jgi:hypothetical protein